MSYVNTKMFYVKFLDPIVQHESCVTNHTVSNILKIIFVRVERIFTDPLVSAGNLLKGKVPYT